MKYFWLGILETPPPFGRWHNLWTDPYGWKSVRFWWLSNAFYKSKCPRVCPSEVGMKEQLAINTGKYLFGAKPPFHWKKCFSWRGHFCRCFEWKYCAVSENVCSMSALYLHFFHCKFQLFSFFLINLSSYVKNLFAKGPIPDLANWTGFLTKY